MNSLYTPLNLNTSVATAPAHLLPRSNAVDSDPGQALDPALGGALTQAQATADPTEGQGSRKRPLTSHIFLHGVKITQDKKEWWRCSECPSADEVEENGGKPPQEHKITGCSTDKPMHHLRNAHGIAKEGKKIKARRAQAAGAPGPRSEYSAYGLQGTTVRMDCLRPHRLPSSREHTFSQPPLLPKFSSSGSPP
jgi:hypothetical protein